MIKLKISLPTKNGLSLKKKSIISLYNRLEINNGGNNIMKMKININPLKPEWLGKTFKAKIKNKEKRINKKTIFNRRCHEKFFGVSILMIFGTLTIIIFGILTINPEKKFEKGCQEILEISVLTIFGALTDNLFSINDRNT